MLRRPFLAVLALAALAPVRVASAQAVDAGAVVRHYSALVSAGYDDALAGAQELREKVRAFVAAPSEATLKAARDAWLAARDVYGQTEAFRFYGGPIDDDSGPEGRINAWPLDEAYIDGVKDKPNAGFVNDRKVKIDKATLKRLNERGGEENIATGWHAIEFMLWGQDLNDDGPGNRSYEDFVDGKAKNADRRRLYLVTVADILVDDLGTVAKAWAPNAKNYRARFERGGNESVRKIIVGLGSLSRGELAGERQEVALSTRDQEDEHSCFSDNTHNDIIANALGIENAWLGRYVRRDGTTFEGASLRELVAQKDPALAERTTKQIAASVAAARAIQAPFDREIAGGRDGKGRERVEASIKSLVQQSKDLTDAAGAIGITRLTLVDPKK